MTPRTLFNIILKILGIFFIKEFLTIIPTLLSVILFLTSPGMLTEAVWSLVTTSLILLAYGLVSYYLIFNTDFVIDKLKLDKGFAEETIPLNIHRSTILSIAIIVIGGYLVVDEIPNFCRQLYSYFQEKRLTYGQTSPTLVHSVISGIKILIGILLMTYQRIIVAFIERQRKNKADPKPN